MRKHEKKSDAIGGYVRLPLSPFRLFLIDTLDLARNRNYVQALMELDVTDCRRALKTARREGGNSLLAWVIYCVGQSLAEHPELNCMRHGRKIIRFQDIDLATIVEMEMGDERIPRLILLRDIAHRSVQQIHEEIYAARSYNKVTGEVMLDDAKSVRQLGLVLRLPRFLRMLVWKRMLRNPFFIKAKMGTVSLTAVGMFGQMSGWAIPIPTMNHAVSFAMGSVVKKTAVIRGQIQIREMLSLTCFFDHDLIDGAPVGRFMRTLTKTVEKGAHVL